MVPIFWQSGYVVRCYHFAKNTKKLFSSPGLCSMRKKVFPSDSQCVLGSGSESHSQGQKRRAGCSEFRAVHAVAGCDLCVRRKDSRSSRGSISSQHLLRCGEGRVSSHQLPLSGALHCAINAFPGWASLGGEGSGPVPRYHGWMTSATLCLTVV